MTTWKATLDTVMRERGAALFGYAYMLTGSRHEADDLVQDALIRTFSRGKAGGSIEQAHTYVKRAMLSAFIDGKRRAAVRPVTTDKDADIINPDPSDQVNTAIELQRAILTLSPRERACIALRYLDDLTVAGVARELGLAEGSVKRYLSDATKKLRELHPELGDLADASSGGGTRVHVTSRGLQR
ncbi:RNA polymerase sigma factor [Demequina oxidasica]|uniref:RNA polymerase sigma factor n=1 Tax=Demequina oxidasica TaxID=676199 RepID=UPI0007844810|nr:sigma-70 family RNA polymerase sigma factor [Demequina oxidasica]